MFENLQAAIWVACGDGIWAIAIATFAASLLLGMLHIGLGVFRRYLN